MQPKVTLEALCIYLSLSKARVQKWISDGYFTPIESVPPGKTRLYGKQDAMRLAAFSRLVATGLSPRVGTCLDVLYGFKSGDAYLVITTHERNLVRRTASATEDVGHPYSASIVRWEEVQKHIDYRRPPLSITIVNLTEVEREVDRQLPRAARYDSEAKKRGSE